ncbi:hypothetical protein HYH03_009052 [Edaphochlamys debaryana]|uniref:Uncharacterized protein n=1 Tax=Edaphochlamys debaryana TaxID=47281 RepID=A0A835Y207_9CHLO|nr:hypothetical protein HYH03_009052 [Edaphochlamys debaryana]|eukprot:KAG2492636.1 hypothetical protein HYH03_009052 [Edaphochlamys debaryana]
MATAVAHIQARGPLPLPPLDPAGKPPGSPAPPLPGRGPASSPAAPAPSSALTAARDATTRRLRELVAARPHEPADSDLPGLIAGVSSLDRAAARSALTGVWQATLLTRDNAAANQAALADAGGVMLCVDFAVARLTGSVGREDEDDVVMALLVLENLSCNVALHRPLVHEPRLLRLLVLVLRDWEALALRVNAAKVLVNLTYGDPRLCARVAAAGGLERAAALLAAPEPALVRQGAALLAHLTAGQGCAERGEAAALPGLLERLKELLSRSPDAPTRAACAEAVANLARGDPAAHADLLRAGLAAPLLAACDPASERRAEAEVVAPCLLALAALAMGGRAAARGLLAERDLVPFLGGILDYSNVVLRDPGTARVLLAAHTLVAALGGFAEHNGITPPGAAGGPGGGAAGAPTYPPEVEQVLKESGYVPFRRSLAALGLSPPAYTAAALGRDLGGPHGFVANASYQVNVELLPGLKHPNARMAINAAARLYQIAVCLADHPEGRAVLANSSLVVALVDLMGSGHSGVLQAALSLLDALAVLPELAPLLVGGGAMDALAELADRHSAQPAAPGPDPAPAPAPNAGAGNGAGKGGAGAGVVHGGAVGGGCDPLVRLLAERALVGMYLAQQ